jgi:HAD superfamily hydrolase (TIGR01549 family)
VRALTSDLWYTLLYHHPADQRRLEAARVRLWSDPLIRAGLSRPSAKRAVDRMDAWAKELEAQGRAPSVARQVRWLSGVSRVRLATDEIAASLDRQINEARVLIAPGARSTLDALHAAGIRLGLVSNLLHGTAPGARALLRQFGIFDCFSVLVFSDEHPWSKPRPEPFLYALSRVRVRPADAAHVGDLAYDIVGPRRAGIRPILYTGLHPYEPRYLRELAYSADPGAERCRTWRAVAARVLSGP